MHFVWLSRLGLFYDSLRCFWSLIVLVVLGFVAPLICNGMAVVISLKNYVQSGAEKR
jgi:hypothetical protein